ncbi:MAG: CBS domain-containing protein [Bacteroidota bacterium]|nr:CBS domain-containing protein [Bacteroidota bacterium]
MTAITTFYLSRIIGLKVFATDGQFLGKLIDLLIETGADGQFVGEPYRPRVVAARIIKNGIQTNLDFKHFAVDKTKGHYSISCKESRIISEEASLDFLLLKANVLDKQIVDLNGRKLVRVNDIRLVAVPDGTYAVAVDVGTEGLLRRIGIVKPLKKFFSLFNIAIPSKFILWDDVEAVDYSTYNIKLGTTFKKLNTLHPSDLADIIEELGTHSRAHVFNNLDEEKAADVLEEMEPKSQVDMIENMPIEKAADVLEKMPANEAADILDMLEEDKAELLLREMETETSEDVRELLEYEDNEVGSLMNTDFLAFSETDTVERVLQVIRSEKPEVEVLYNIFIINDSGKLAASLSLRDLVVSEPTVKLADIMNKKHVYVHDMDRLDRLAEIVSKYNLLSVPVVGAENELLGMVVIDDIVEDLMGRRRTK